MQITGERLEHSISVARKMRDFAEKYKDICEITPEEAFTLGLLHDVGYEFVEDVENHNTIGGLVMKSQGYKYWQEIYYHGEVQEEYNSIELMLLNLADMTTSPRGGSFTFTNRLKNIGERYGCESTQYKNSEKIIEMLKKSELEVDERWY